jgi:mannose-1-phosphate guanylyltransferase
MKHSHDHNFLEQLDNQGLKKTELRLAVLKILSEANSPLSADEISQKLKKVSFDRATLFRTLKTFTEKPTEDIAKTFIESGEFLWNAGIFAWNLKTIMNRFETNLNEVHQLFSEIDYLNNYKTILEKAYGQSPSISIDYGILEKDKAVFVLPADFGWSDLGTWKSLWEVSTQDAQQNSLIGKNVKAFDTKNSLVFTQKEKLIILNGVDNLVVVESDDAILIMNKDREQELRGIVNEVKEKYKGKYN